MFVITGANGQTGGAVARTLLQQNQPVRVVLRPGRSGEEWQSQGAEVAHADVQDKTALTDAFTGARAAYVMNPPAYAVDDMLVSARAVADAYRAALEAGGARAVALSSFGSQHAEGTGNILTTYVLEQALSPLGASFVRPGGFMTNWLPSLPTMRNGVLPSFYAPLDRPIPQVAVADIADTVVRELQRSDSRTIELAGPADYAPTDVAAAFSVALGRPVTAQAIERDQWPQALAQFGLPPAAIHSWMEMWEGLNSGHIRFEGTPERGQMTIEDFAKASVAGAQARA
ncbi:NmrA family NAD(P)-binding protein [Streptomyces inhibens]|uniref:NmrA family NAD(P)-binding protein n=1 Tax=Streptomyces inhibens TaxID=2293571 RepID=UPI001EE78024|nr:NmrA family NAD(P)-binding protein [Streptomyces inhibens]UKY47493.1 NmrA family NAD(P)-binding protein [Streptomyces inhibens]